LPSWRVAKLNDLLSKSHLPGTPRRQIDQPSRHLCGKPKTVSRRRAARDDDLTALSSDRFY